MLEQRRCETGETIIRETVTASSPGLVGKATEGLAAVDETRPSRGRRSRRSASRRFARRMGGLERYVGHGAGFPARSARL
jgi:hypothetical protein